jgi:hypothetical protein
VDVGRLGAVPGPSVRGHRPPIAPSKQAQWVAPMSRSRSGSCKERGSGGTVKLWWTPMLETYEVVEIMIVRILK